jgi:spermidine/putrescine transport system permease protein
MNVLKSTYALLVYCFLYLPILVVVVQSFNAAKYGTSWKGFTLAWYEKALGSPVLVEAALNSLWVAVLAATLATGLGTLGAICLFRYRFRGREIMRGLLLALMMIPDIVMGISLLVLFVVLGWALGFWTLLIAHITFCLPFVVVTVYARLRDLNPHLVEAALDLGASEWRALRAVVIPLMAPAIAAGWLLSFTLSIDDVIVSFFSTGPTFEILPLRIYSMVRVGVKPEVNALATLLFVVPFIFITLSQFFSKEEEGT